MEHVGGSLAASTARSTDGYSGTRASSAAWSCAAAVADDYHVFAVEWEPRSIVWRLDGTPYHRATPSELAPHEWVFEQPFYLLLNLAVGGTFGGDVADGTVFPQALSVDYVRVFEAASAS